VEDEVIETSAFRTLALYAVQSGRSATELNPLIR